MASGAFRKVRYAWSRAQEATDDQWGCIKKSLMKGIQTKENKPAQMRPYLGLTVACRYRGRCKQS